MKRLALIGLAVLLSIGVFVNGAPKVAAKTNEVSGILDLNDLEEMEKKGEVIIEEVTYDEYVKEAAINKGITEEEVRKQYPDRTRSLNYSDGSQIANYVMHRVTFTQNVTASYVPRVQIWLYMLNYNSFREIIEIQDVSLDRLDSKYGYTSKQFSGTVQARLLSGIQLWWAVNGDFYNNGTTTVSGGGSGGIGKLISVNLSVSHSSNHFKYWNNAGHYSIY